MYHDLIKSAILNNTIEKNFGCIHCKEDSELCIDNMSLLVDEINKILNDKLKELQHHKDTTVGLYAFDFDPKLIIHKFINSQSDACSLVVEDAEQLQKDWEDFIDNKNYFKTPFFKL